MSFRGCQKVALSVLVSLLLWALGLFGLTAAERSSEPLRLLFIGNSLTASNDLPLLVEAMATHQGRPVKATVRTTPNYALEDHWMEGANRLLTSRRHDVVILQQGPSSRPESREHLRQWTGIWAEAARAAGTRVAVFMVWPVAGTRDGFALVGRSYREAAVASGSLLLPAGEAWETVLAGPTPPALHASDGLHPTLAGSFLAAMVIVRDLVGIDPAKVPAQLRLGSRRTVALPEDVVARFRAVLSGN